MGEAGCILEIRVLSGVLVPHCEDGTRMYYQQYWIMQWDWITQCNALPKIHLYCKFKDGYRQCAKKKKKKGCVMVKLWVKFLSKV